MTLALLLPLLTTFGLILCRVTGIVLLVPVIGGEQVPLQLRGAVTLVLSAVLTPLCTPPTLAGALPLILAGAGELLLGLAMGMVVKLVLLGAEFAGELSGMQMGLSFNRVVDPSSGEEIAITAQLMNALALLLWVSVDGHHLVLLGLGASIREAPVGTVLLRAGYADTLFPLLSMATTTALRISAPVVVALLLANAMMGLISRAAPQLQLFSFAFGVSIVIGIILFSTSVGPSLSLLIEQIQRVPDYLTATFGA